KFFVTKSDTKLVAANSTELLKWNLFFLQNRRRLLQVFGLNGNDDPRLRFVKKRCGGRRVAWFQIDLRAEKFFRIETTFSKGNSETTFAAIVRAFYQA